MSAVSTNQTEQASDRRRWIALVVLCLGFLMIILDQTIVNVALPSIQHDLHFSQSGLAWVINAYLIAFGGLLLLVGRLGDLVGRRRIFLSGLVLFTVASLVCGISDSQGMLVGARFVQGIGGAMTSAVILGMIVTMFPKPSELARAIGVYAFVASAGGALGLLAGGALTQALNWHWIFFVNLPIGVITLALSLRLLPNDKGLGFGSGADIAGSLLLVGSLMLVVYAIVEAANDGWGSAHTLGFGGAGVAMLAGFLVRQATAANPLMPLRVFRSRDVSAANLIQMSLVAGLFGVFFLGALYLEHVLGYDPIQIGLAFLPLALGIAVMSLGVSAKLIDRVGARRTLAPSMALVGVGILLFRIPGTHVTYLTQLLPATLAMGIGAGVAFPSLMTLAMSTATPEDSGLVSGLVNTSQQVGGALGLSVLATLASSRSSSLRDAGWSATHALTDGYHLAFLIGIFAVAAGVALSVWLVFSPHAPAGTVQEIIEDGEPESERLHATPGLEAA
jgi:EmrB/QacA subfamily drug resistance transporter